MDCLSIVEHSPLLTSFIHPNSHETLYTVESQIHPGGWHSSSIDRADAKNGVFTQLAKVTYFDWSNIRVRFDTRQVDLDAFLRRASTTSNSRIFVAPNGQTYKWRISGQNIELYSTSSRTLLARYLPPRPGFIMRKARPGSLQLFTKSYDFSRDRRTLDAVIVTFVVMEHLLRDRTKYTRPL